MRHPRIFESGELIVGSSFELSPDGAGHVGRVLRMTTGDTLTLFNGKGGQYQATIEQTTKKSVTVHIDEFQDINSESSYTKFVNICNTVGKALLPEFPKSDRKSQLSNNQQICKLRNKVLMANIEELHVTQKNLREDYDI